MPSPKALLRDIAAQGLDPNLEYHSIGKDGHIRDHRHDVAAVHKPIVAAAPKHVTATPEVKVEVTKEMKDGVEEEKVDVTVGELKVEVEVPVVAEGDDKKDAELPEIPDGKEEVVLASSKKNKAKKVEAKKPDEKPAS
jgi:hypothetical protein